MRKMSSTRRQFLGAAGVAAGAGALGIPAWRVSAQSAVRPAPSMPEPRFIEANGIRIYYKDVSDDGLFAAYAETIQRVGDERLRIYLYHIPPQSQTPISFDLIERLVKAYPETVVGMKDSSGVFDNMAGAARRFPGFAVFTGADHLLLGLLRAGGVGCITAACNLAPHWLQAILQGWRGEEAEELQARMTGLREIIAAFPLVPGLRAIVARESRDDSWGRPRPPLMPLEGSRCEELYRMLDDLGFSMPSRVATGAPDRLEASIS